MTKEEQKNYLLQDLCSFDIKNQTDEQIVLLIEQAKEYILQNSPFNSITYKDLKKGDILVYRNKLILEYIGDVDLIGGHLFKTIWSPFATTVWIKQTNEQISEKEIILIK